MSDEARQNLQRLNQTGDRYQLNDVETRNVTLETKHVALDNMITLTLKLCHQTFPMSYSTENRRKRKRPRIFFLLLR